MVERPANEQELQEREAAGVIRASRFVRTYAHTHEPITVATIKDIQREIFTLAWPEVAGVWREEEITITDSKHFPAHFSQVATLMQEMDKELKARLKKLKSIEFTWFDDSDWTDEQMVAIDHIVETAAWVHHRITYIHPFREGNGRTARLTTNLILQRYGLSGLSIKVERENKNRYRAALAQADQVQDYDPLKSLIYEGLIDRYNGVPMAFVKDRK